LSQIVGFDETYAQTHDLTIKALSRLKELYPGKKFAVTRLCFHANTLQRLVRAKFIEENDPTELNELFQFHYDAIMEICREDEKKFAIPMMVATIRKGVFSIDNKADNDTTHKGLSLMQNEEYKEVLKILKNEISEYEALAGRRTRKETRYRLFLD